ncbi:MAG: GNAT family N-acetyltransferase [Actinomycetota bacterium]
MAISFRSATGDDYDFVVRRIDEWWGGREMAQRFHRLFFEYLGDTAIIAEEGGRIVAFLAGVCSTSRPDEAYIHFVGVDPEHRGRGLGRKLYERFFSLVRQRGCRTVHAVTAPVNLGSIAFHRAMGFEPAPGDAEVDGLPVHTDHLGPGFDVVEFRRQI